MKRISILLLIPLFMLTVLSVSCAAGGAFDDLLKEMTKPDEGNDEDTVIAGLKEALRIGTGNAVGSVSEENGYFDNLAIKIPIPRELEKADELLRKVGMGDRVDDFVLSMNRAAEKAAPQAADIFISAVKEMSITDAFDILGGHETAATDFFQEKTSDRLYGLFKPVVTDTMGQTGVVKSYKRLVDKYTSIPFVKDEPVDLEDYVTDMALAGLFHMVGEEEKKIREDPAARVTDLLKKVFGK
jgi:hypothetical protein